MSKRKTNIKRNSVVESPENGVVIQNLVIRPIQRKSQDIEAWRNAIRAAEGMVPVYGPLLDLIEDILLDGTLSSLVDKRVNGVTKVKMKFVNSNKEEVPAMSELLKKKGFRDLRKAIQRRIPFGHRVVELINDEKGFRIYEPDARHVKRKDGLVTFEQYGTEGVYYRNPPASNYIVEVGKWNDLGLLMKAAQYVIYKRGGFGDWAQYAEIFGMPFREARYDGYNQEVRMQLEKALQEFGGAGYAILPEEAKLTIHENKNSQGTGELYNSLRKACNEELAILFLGQTETTSKTAGKMGGNDDTHEETEDDINADDREDELALFNELIKPVLINLGFPADQGEFIYEVKEAKLSVKDKVDIAIKIKKEGGVPVGDEHFYEVTGIEKPADYNQQKADMQEQREQMPQGGKPPKKKGDKKEKETAEEKLAWLDRFRLSLADFFVQAPKD